MRDFEIAQLHKSHATATSHATVNSHSLGVRRGNLRQSSGQGTLAYRPAWFNQ